MARSPRRAGFRSIVAAVAAGALLGAVQLLVAQPPPAATAQPAKSARVGFLSPYSAAFDKEWRAALRRGLADLGYVEPNNLLIVERHANGANERLPDLAREVARLKVDVFVSHGDLATRAARASGTVPIVMCPHADPIGAGLVRSLARPGGNITGLSDSHGDLLAKRLALLKEVVPSASRVGVLFNPDSPALAVQWKDIQVAAPALGLSVLPLNVRRTEDIEPAFVTLRQGRVEALNVLGGAAPAQLGRVAELAIRHRVPSVSTTRRAVEDGLLMAYGADFADLYRRAAAYVDKILAGAKPGDLPIEQPVKFELTVNRRTARALGLTIPASLLLRADRVIE